MLLLEGQKNLMGLVEVEIVKQTESVIQRDCAGNRIDGSCRLTEAGE